MEKLSIITIGGSGFVGQSFISRLTHEVNHLGDFSRSPDGSGFDITNISQINEVVNRLRPNAVVNFAALVDTKAGIDQLEAYRGVNALGPKNLVEVCLPLGITVAQVSTDQVFSGRQTGSITESDLPDADQSNSSVYASTKREGESYVSGYANGLVVRLANPTSIAVPPRSDFLRKLILPLLDKGIGYFFKDQVLNPTVLEDYIDAFIQLLIRRKTGIYNGVGAPAATPYDIGREVAHQLGLSPEEINRVIIGTSVVEYNQAKGTYFPVNLNLNNSAIERDSGIKMRTAVSIIPQILDQLPSESKTGFIQKVRTPQAVPAK